MNKNRVVQKIDIYRKLDNLCFCMTCQDSTTYACKAQMSTMKILYNIPSSHKSLNAPKFTNS